MNVVAMCTLSTGLSAIRFALDMGVKITKVIGLDGAHNRDKDAITGVVDISKFCTSKNLDFDYVSDYSLKKESTKILGDNVDLLWVCGWQRLLPDSFVETANLATIGAHGSCDGILKGRGRSPQNWALMIGADKFQISIFKISSGVDDGDIIATDEFQLTVYDTINSSYFKSSYLVARMFSKVYFDHSSLELSSKQQGVASYFPKRTQDDGSIDWSMGTIDVHNQIKALEAPYPNAFSRCNDSTIFFNRSVPIKVDTTFPPGEIIEIREDGTFIISCIDGFLHIIDYHMEGVDFSLCCGLKLESVDISQSANIIYGRFKHEFPNKKINQTLLEFWKRNHVTLL